MLFLLIANNLLLRVDITNEEYAEADKLSKERDVPLVDSLHAVQARNHKAMMISQDRHFIEQLQDVVKMIRPQEII